MAVASFVLPIALHTKRSPTISPRKLSQHRRYRMSSPSSNLPPVQIPPELQAVRALGLGMAGIDILARVKAFPVAESKIRTTGLSILGGGNTANSLTALRRLGVPCTLLTKLGSDMYGTEALRELNADGIDTSKVVVKSSVNTSFTYVIVDATEDTRTCIATASNEDLLPHEIDESLLDGVSLVLLDGRHTLAAIQLAKYAQQKGVPILLDIERERPHIRTLLPYADYIVTNRIYPFVFAPQAANRVQALQILLEHCDARFVISTMGQGGSMLVRRDKPREKGVAVDMLVQSKRVRHYDTSNDYEVLECPTCRVENIVDTTGAGDAFVGAVAYGILHHMEYERMLCLASHVAAEKLKGLGARSALPRREALAPILLANLPSFLD